MANEDGVPTLPPVVSQVLAEVASRLKSDEFLDLESEAVNRLLEILSGPTVPKPDEIEASLFGSKDGDQE